MGLFSKTPEEERYEYGRQQGEMLRNNPALLKRLMEQQQTAAQAGQRQQYLTGLMGQQAAPAQYEQQTQPVEGPMMPGQERGLMGVNQQTEEAVEGSGVLGGNMPTSEVAMRLMMAPTKESRAVGGQMLNQQMKPGTPRSETWLEFYQRDPEGFAKARAAYNKGTGTKNVITVGDKIRGLPEEMKLEDEKARWTDSRQFIKSVIDTGRTARDEGHKTDRMLSILNRGARTGFGAKEVLQAKQMLRAAGKDVDTADAEELQVLMGDLVMARVAQTKGAVSQKEMDLFTQYSANFGKTPEGNKQILTFYKKALDRSKKLYSLVKRMQKEGKTSLEIEESIINYQDKNPLTIEPPKEATEPGIMSFEEWKAAGKPRG